MTNKDFLQLPKFAVTDCKVAFPDATSNKGTSKTLSLFHTTYVFTVSFDTSCITDDDMERFINYLENTLVKPYQCKFEIINQKAILENGLVNTEFAFKLSVDGKDEMNTPGDIAKLLHQIVDNFVEQYIDENASAKYKREVVLRYCPSGSMNEPLEQVYNDDTIKEPWIGIVVQVYGDKLTYNKDKSCICNSWNNVVILNPKLSFLAGKEATDNLVNKFKHYMSNLDKRTHVLYIDEKDPEITLEIPYKNNINVNIFKILKIQNINSDKDQKYMTIQMRSGYAQIDAKSFKWSWKWTVPNEFVNIVSISALLKLKTKSWVHKRFVEDDNKLFNHHLNMIDQYFSFPAAFMGMSDDTVIKDKASLYPTKVKNDEGQKAKKTKNRPNKTKNHFQNNKQQPFSKMDK